MLKLREELDAGYIGRRITVEKHLVETERGQRFVYEIAKVANAVAVLAVTPNGDLVLVCNYRHPVGDTIIEVPAGKLEETDSDPLHRAKEELREEAGYVADVWQSYGVVFSSPGITNEVIHLFLATKLKPVERELEDSELGMTVETFSLNDIKQMLRDNRIKDQKTCVCLMRYILDNNGW